MSVPVVSRLTQSIRRKIEEGLEPICGSRSPQIVELALHFAGYETVPEETGGIRRFVYVDLHRALETMLDDPELARRVTEVVASGVIDTTGVIKLEKVRRSGRPQGSKAREVIPPPKRVSASPTRRRRLSASEKLSSWFKSARKAVLTTSVRASASPSDRVHAVQTRSSIGVASEPREICSARYRDFAEERVTGTPRARTSRSPSQDAAAHPVLVLSEHPEMAHRIQDALFKRVDVMHHENLDHFESDLHALRRLDPVLALDARGRFKTFCRGFLARCPQEARVLVWGRWLMGEPNLGPRMVEVLESRKVSDVAHVLGSVLPPRLRKEDR